MATDNHGCAAPSAEHVVQRTADGGVGHPRARSDALRCQRWDPVLHLHPPSCEQPAAQHRQRMWSIGYLLQCGTLVHADEKMRPSVNFGDLRVALHLPLVCVELMPKVVRCTRHAHPRSKIGRG
jgi:hypothetical protein